jgi:hypothetical protein
MKRARTVPLSATVAHVTVTASELARRNDWDVKAVRDRLRDLEDAGHPICGRHRRNELWDFTEQEAQQLEAAFRADPRRRTSRRGGRAVG